MDLADLVHAVVSAGRWISALMSLLFVFAAVVQWNDPDPLLWILAYLSTALLAGFHAARGAAPAKACFALAGALAAGSALLVGSLLQADAGAFTSFSMKDETAEEARECIGLLLAALYALVLGLEVRRAGRQPLGTSPS